LVGNFENDKIFGNIFCWQSFLLTMLILKIEFTKFRLTKCEFFIKFNLLQSGRIFPARPAGGSARFSTTAFFINLIYYQPKLNNKNIPLRVFSLKIKTPKIGRFLVILV